MEFLKMFFLLFQPFWNGQEAVYEFGLTHQTRFYQNKNGVQGEKGWEHF